ncbi:hypothetical protein WBG78_14250 [Chryseolinea sp. T2]|uniref:hypothetical protein n=1 Tax=Chryseolinea sp. T2 TaxID=3129255 RepID=UPI003076C0F4
MKRYLLIIVAISLSVHVLGQWKSTNGPVGGVQSLYISGSDIYAVGYESFFRSAGGGDWSKITLTKRPDRITCFVELDRIQYVGTETSGIYFSADGIQWAPIQNNDKLQDSLHVSAITAVGTKLLANVYHVGSHGNHSRIYEFERQGRNLRQAVQFDAHLYVWSFTFYTASKVLMATDKGIFLYDMASDNAPIRLSEVPTRQIVFAGTTYFAVPLYESGLLYRWLNVEEDGSWRKVDIGLNQIITDLVIRPDGYYATTWNTVYYTTFNNLGGDWTPIDNGMGSETLYASSIVFQGSTKYVATNKGVFKSVGNNTWSPFNNSLATAYVTSIFTFNNEVYAASGDGVFKSAFDNGAWESAPHDILKLPTYTAQFAAIGSTLFVGTNNGMLATANGKSWKDVGKIPKPSDFSDSYYSQRFWVKSLVPNASSLYTVTYETPYISNDLGARWQEVRGGLPSGRVIHKLFVIDKQVYLLLEEYPSVHDVWHGALRTSVYKLRTTSPIIWDRIGFHEGDSRFFYSAVLGSNIIYLHYINDKVSLRSLNTKSPANGPTTLKLPQTDPYAITNIFVLKDHLFITTYLGETFVSLDQGNTWEAFAELPQGVSSVSTFFLSGDKDETLFAGLSGAGIWKMPFANFFLPKLEINQPTKVTARTVEMSGTVTPKGNYSVIPYFEYSKTEDFSTFSSVIADPPLVKAGTQTVTRKLMPLEGNTNYFIRLRGEIAKNASAEKRLTLKTPDYLNIAPPSDPVVKMMEADPITDKVTAETCAKHPVSLKVTALIDSTAVQLHTRGLTDKDWSIKELTSINDAYSTVLPFEDFDELGLEYYFSVVAKADFRDPAKKILETEHSKVAITFPTGITFKEEIRYGMSSSDYNLVSFPLSLDNADITSILDDIVEDATDRDRTKWRFLTYIGDQANDNLWDEFPEEKAKHVVPGRGYWFGVADEPGESKLETGAGSTVVSITSAASGNYYDGEFFVIKLQPGYNQIGNPFTYRVRWADVKAANPSAGDLIVFSNEEGELVRNNQDAILEPFSGGYVSNGTTEALLKIPTQKNRSINSGRTAGEEEYVKQSEFYLGFTLSNAHRVCRLGGLGIIADASEGKDAYDLVSPPSLGDFPSIQFSDEKKSLLTRSLVPPGGEGNEWEFTARPVQENQTTVLSWSAYKIAEGNELWLHDLSNEELTNMSSTDVYSFNGTRSFRVYYGTPAYLQEHLQPGRTVLSMSPNPFRENAMINFTLPKSSGSALVKFSLVDMKGNDLGGNSIDTYEPGFHSIEWNITNTSLSSGLYLLRMEVSTQNNTNVYYQKVIRQ